MLFEIEGVQPNLTSFSVQTDVVSLDPSDTSAGVGGVAVSTPLHNSGLTDLWNFLYGSHSTLRVGDSSVPSVITEMNLSDLDQLSLSGEMPLRPLQAHQLVLPFQGTFNNAIRHIVESVLVAPSLEFDASLPVRTTVVPAMYGNVWVFLREFMNLHRIEVVVKPNGVLSFRAVGAGMVIYDIENTTHAPKSQGVTVSGAKASEYVAVEYFNNEYITSGTVYPVSTEEPNVISVEAGEVAVIELQTLTGMSQVNQPPAMDWIGPDFDGEGTTGGYTIAGDDGLPVKASSWLEAGGNVRVDIKEDDPYTLIVTVTAPTDGVLATVNDANTAAPYHLAMTDGTLYPRFFVTGTGVRTEPQELTLYTGANDAIVEPGVGFTATNPHVGSLSQAYDVGLRLAQAYSGASTEYTRSSPSYDNFTDTQGAKFKTPDANYRVQSASYTPEGVAFTATAHSTFDDFHERWATRPKSFNDFNSFWALQPKKRFRDFAVSPLR